MILWDGEVRASAMGTLISIIIIVVVVIIIILIIITGVWPETFWFAWSHGLG